MLKHSVDGSDRLVYCVESPESWIEDFGKGQLVNGKADVKLDADFAAVVETKEIHVFFTETGGHHALHLTGTSATGFTVEADAALLTLKGKKATDANGTFSYRVVAKPKTDVKLRRLEKFTVPKPRKQFTEADLPKIPKIPEGRPQRP